MLFTLCLVLLLTPLPTLQSPASERRNSTGSDMIKSNAILAPSLPKTIASLAKQNLQAIPKPDTGNHTISTTLTSRQKPPMVNGTKITKMKQPSTVIQVTLSTSPKPVPVTIKDKQTVLVNKTVLMVKTPSTSDIKTTKNKTVTNVVHSVHSKHTKPAADIGAKTAKVKTTPSANQTVAVNSPAISSVKNPQDKSSPPVIQKIQLPPMTAAASSVKVTKDKSTASVNHTISIKTPLESNDKTITDRPAITVAKTVPSTSTSGTTANKVKQTASVNQPTSVKTSSDFKTNTDKPVLTVLKSSQSKPTKSDTVSTTTVTKEKFTSSVNRTVFNKTSSANDGKSTKVKSIPTLVQHHQPASIKPATTNGTSTSKDKLTDTANQTAVVKSHSNIVIKSHTDSDTKGNKVKPDLKVVQTVPSTKPATAGGNITNKDKSMPSVNQTHVIKSPTAGEGKAKEKPASMQPIKVVISEGCGSSNSKEQEVKLRPGSPLVMTHKISLIPGECSGGCVAEMAELKARVDRLEREMTSLKEQWNCPNECNGNGKCEMGKCICFLGFLGSDCSRCAPGANCEKKADKGKFKINVETVNMRISQGSNTIRDNTHGKNVKAEQTTFQKRDQRKGGESKDVETKPKVATNVKVATIKSQAKQESIVTKTNIKGPVSATKASEATLGQVLLKHKGKKQEEARKGRTTVLTAKELLPKADINQVTIREAVVKSHAKSGQLQDQPQTNETLGTVKNTNGTAKVLTILTKVTETSNNKTKAGKGTLQQNVLNKKVKMESVDASKMASVENTKTQTGNIGSGKAKGTQKSQYLVNVTTVESGVPAENTKTQAGKIGSGKVKGPQKKQYSMNVTSVESGVSIANTRTRTGKIGSGKAQGTENNQYLVNVTSVEGGVSVETTKTLTGKIGSGKAKGPQKNQHSMNVTSVESRDATKVNQNKTVIQFAWNATRRAGGAGLGSVKISNISSYSFTLTWSAPQGMFRNFTVIRREHRMEGEGTTEEEVVDKNMDDDNTATTTTTTTTSARNTTEVQTQREGTNVTSASAAKATGPKGKAEDQRVSMVLPGSVRSVEFGHLQPHTRYSLQVFGTALGKRSKIHRIAATTGPEPATELVFSNVTESSVTLSWSKPKSTFTGFKVTYTHYITGESTFETLDAQQSQMVLSKLSAGSSYIISVTTLHGKAQSDALTSVITTVPAPPAQFKAVNVTDTRALLQWMPSLGKVDRFIISYESAKIPNVTVTVMVSGNAVEHQLRGLQRGTVYTVKAMSQKGSLQSMVISTTFTTANMVKASEVGARFAVITWNAPTVVYHSYRLTYHVAGEVTKEVTLDRTITQYKLTGLLPMTHYTILVQGERDGQYTSIVTTDFVTGKLRFPYPTDCSQELSNGALHSGEVDIYPHGKDAGSFRVYCDMETDGGGWTVFQRRMNGKTDFYRTWNNYSIGFGNVSEEFWLGNRLLHNLTRMGAMSLRVDLRAGNDSAYAHYSNFTIDTEENHYSIMLSGYTGTAGDSMRYHNGRPFSTRDKDPQTLGIHCARAYMGGWWYKNCYKTNLNGLYGINSNNQGVVWIDWKGKDSSLPFTEMKIRPTAFSHVTHDGGQL